MFVPVERSSSMNSNIRSTRPPLLRRPRQSQETMMTRSTTTSIIYAIFALLSIWAIIITVTFSILHWGQRVDISDVTATKNTIVKNLDTVVTECCTFDFENCTCQGIPPEFLDWNAQINSPELRSRQGNEFQQYVVSQSGTTILDGTNFWESGDYARFVPDAGVWFKNEARGLDPIPMETYNVTFVIESTQSNALASPFSTTTQIKLFLIGNGFAIFHMDAFSVRGSSELRCPPDAGNIMCTYDKIRAVGFSALPTSRVPIDPFINVFPFSDLFTKFIWTDLRNCLNGNSNATFQCGDGCGPGSQINNVNPSAQQIGYLSTIVFSLNGDITINFPPSEGACHQVRQVYFLYALP